MNNIEIFLSYCWADEKIADEICDFFKSKKEITIHRDKIDIGVWRNIKEFMQSISKMDYVIILISEKYLESDNCMYEVLEVMRDRNYADKIFPVVIYDSIYNPIVRAGYVKHWEDKFRDFEIMLDGLKVQNVRNSAETLKQYQDIASNIDEFLGKVADMNNPQVTEASLKIVEALKTKGVVIRENAIEEPIVTNDFFVNLGIAPKSEYAKPTDLEINKFMSDSYKQIIKLLESLCDQYKTENMGINIRTEQVDSRTNVFQFYKNGNLARGIKIFRGNMSGRIENICISDCTMSFGSNNSWNGQYDYKFDNGELKLTAPMSFGHSQELMDVGDVVKDIWINYIQLYLER